MIAPVTKRAASEQRYETESATSFIRLLIIFVSDMFRSFDIWVHKFPEFAAVFRRAGSPVTNQIANFDRNFKGLCRQGGQGNTRKL